MEAYSKIKSVYLEMLILMLEGKMLLGDLI